jgi:hypothetical protein
MYPYTARLGMPGKPAFDFELQKIQTPQGNRFLISVANRNGGIHRFEMTSFDHGWRIINAPKVADWLLQFEDSLSKAIGQLPPAISSGENEASDN